MVVTTSGEHPWHLTSRPGLGHSSVNETVPQSKGYQVRDAKSFLEKNRRVQGTYCRFFYTHISCTGVFKMKIDYSIKAVPIVL